MRLLNDILYFGMGVNLIAFGLFNMIRAIVSFEKFLIAPVFLVVVMLGWVIIRTRIKERRNDI